MKPGWHFAIIVLKQVRLSLVKLCLLFTASHLLFLIKVWEAKRILQVLKLQEESCSQIQGKVKHIPSQRDMLKGMCFLNWPWGRICPFQTVFSFKSTIPLGALPVLSWMNPFLCSICFLKKTGELQVCTCPSPPKASNNETAFCKKGAQTAEESNSRPYWGLNS